MKHAFTSQEIAHIWAHKGAGWGKCPGNASFEGDTFKSYATVIARRITHKGKTAYVYDGHGFSISTSKVQNRLRQALSHETVFHINAGQRGQRLDFTPAKLIAYYLAEAKKIETALPSRLARMRAEQYASATSQVANAREVAAFFGLGLAKLDATLAKREAGQADAENTLKAAREKQLAAKAKEVKRQEKEAAENVIRWLNGERVSIPYGLPTMLRARHVPGNSINGNEVDEMVMETSNGARVPLAEAEKTFRFVITCRAKGWHRNGSTHEIGAYQLDAVNEQGVIAGCHRVSWEEIERFAKAQGWVI